MHAQSSISLRTSTPVGSGAAAVLAALCLSVFSGAAHGAVGPAVAPLPGSVDRSIGWNSQAFAQDTLWTEGRVEYAVWVDAAGYPFIGRRLLGTPSWETFPLGSIPGNPLRAPTKRDSHNVYVVGVDSRGFVHVAGNMHADPLRTVRTRRPHDIRSWVVDPMAGSSESSVTYPAFVRLRDKTLLFLYRDGVSGDGRVIVNALDPGRDTWRRLGVLLDGTPSGESPYLQHVAVDRRGWIHVMAVWRRGADPKTNNDLSYVRSRDGGETWERSDGAPLALPVTHATSEVILDTPAAGASLANAGGLEVDGRGRPHGVVRIANERGRASLVHVWRVGRKWRQQRAALPWQVATRPSLLVSRAGRVAALVSSASTGGRWRARLVLLPVRRAPVRVRPLIEVAPGWEITFDTQALRRTGALRILVPLGTGTGGGVVSYGPRTLDALLRA